MEGTAKNKPVKAERKHGKGKPLFVAYCKDYCKTHWNSWAESNYHAVLWHKQRSKNCNPGCFMNNEDYRNKESSNFKEDGNEHDDDCVGSYSDLDDNVSENSNVNRAKYLETDDEFEGNMNAPDSSDIIDENEMDEVRIDADSLIDIDMVNKCKFKYKPMTIGERDALCQKFFNIKNQKPSFIIFELQRWCSMMTALSIFVMFYICLLYTSDAADE